MYTVKQPTNEVKFNKKYYELIKDGIKTQTMRLARKRLDVNEGDVVNAIFPGTDLTIPITILKIGYKQAKSINLDDAVREGYQEISSLLNELYHIYPNMNRFDRLYYYQFKVIKEKPNFKVVEENLDDYWGDYEEFIRLYNENKIPVTEIRSRLNMKIKKYNSYRKTAISEGRLHVDVRNHSRRLLRK